MLTDEQLAQIRRLEKELDRQEERLLAGFTPEQRARYEELSEPPAPPETELIHKTLTKNERTR